MSVRPFSLGTALALGVLLTCVQPAARAQRPGGPPPFGGPPPPGGRFGGPPPGGPFGSPSQRVDRLAHDLNLSKAQKAKLLPILKAQDAKMRAMFHPGGPPPSRQQFDKMRTTMDAYRAKINAILTPKQRTKFAAMRPRGGGGPPGGGPPGGPPPPR